MSTGLAARRPHVVLVRFMLHGNYNTLKASRYFQIDNRSFSERSVDARCGKILYVLRFANKLDLASLIAQITRCIYWFCKQSIGKARQLQVGLSLLSWWYHHTFWFTLPIYLVLYFFDTPLHEFEPPHRGTEAPRRYGIPWRLHQRTGHPVGTGLRSRRTADSSGVAPKEQPCLGTSFDLV
jgi:hypothetical protein